MTSQGSGGSQDALHSEPDALPRGITPAEQEAGTIGRQADNMHGRDTHVRLAGRFQSLHPATLF